MPFELPAIPKRAKFFRSSQPIAPHPTYEDNEEMSVSL